MNPTLIRKAPRTESERILQHREHEKEYMKRHKTMCVTLSKEKDSDILAWLETKENKSDAVRQALRASLRREGTSWRKFHINGNTARKKRQEEEC